MNAINSKKRMREEENMKLESANANKRRIKERKSFALCSAHNKGE
jgi:hypothetical protein